MEKEELSKEQQVPKKFSVFLLFLLCVITSSIYSFVWYIINVAKLNNLNTKTKLNKKIALITLVIFVIIIILMVPLFYIAKTSLYGSSGPATSISEVPIQFAIVFITYIILLIIVSILTLFLAFRTRKILNEALINKGEKVRVSGFFTLIFNLFYLQYEINRIIDDKENNKKLGPWIIFIILLLIIIAIPILIFFLFQNLTTRFFP